MELITWLIEQGANDMNSRLIAALESNNKDLVIYFIERGANNFEEGLNIVAQKSNVPLTQYLLHINNIKIPNSAVGYALETGNIELINILSQQNINIQPIILGQIVRILVDKLKFVTKLGRNYENNFLLLKMGYVSYNVLPYIMKLYIYENNLGDIGSFMMDPFLKHLFGKMPSLFEYQMGENELVPILNTKGNSTIQVVNKFFVNKINVDERIYTLKAVNLIMPNIIRENEWEKFYTMKEINEIVDFFEDNRERIGKEEILLKGLVNTYVAK